MPEKDWKILVADMVEHARYARDHARGLDEPSFQRDLKTIHAVTRCIEVIGEAARRAPQSVRDRAPNIPWAQILGTRHILAHDYGRVDSTLLWRLLEGRLAALEADLQALLDLPE